MCLGIQRKKRFLVDDCFCYGKLCSLCFHVNFLCVSHMVVAEVCLMRTGWRAFIELEFCRDESIDFDAFLELIYRSS